MEIWLTLKGDRLRLPITPFFEIPYSNNNSTENLNEIGTINLAGNAGLRTCSVQSFFPAQRYAFLENSDAATDPYYYDRKIREWARMKEPLRLIITETPHNFEVLIDSYISGEQDGTGDVYYSIELSEYVRIEATQAESSTSLEAENIERFEDDPHNIPSSLTTASEYDTPWTMAKKLTGNGDNAFGLLVQSGIAIYEEITGKVFKL